MMEVTWKEWNGKRYLLNDFRGAKSEEDLVVILQKEIDIISNTRGKNPILSDYSDINLTSGFMDKVKEAFKDIGNEKISKSAIIGVVGLTKLMMDIYLFFTRNKQTKTFFNEQSALAWLFL